VPFEEYFSRIGDTARCNILIETRAAIQNIEAICAVPGISTLILAGLDLSVNLGCPGRFDDPEFLEAVVIGGAITTDCPRTSLRYWRSERVSLTRVTKPLGSGALPRFADSPSLDVASAKQRVDVLRPCRKRAER
jgi:hypothetical protein